MQIKAKIEDTQKGINNTENNKTQKAIILKNLFPITPYYTLYEKIQIKKLNARHIVK